MTVLAAGFTEQAQVTNWPARIALVGVVVAIIVAVLWSMRRGWRARQRRQADIPQPHPVPAEFPAAYEPIGGLYFGTATAGDWLDRIAVHGLGVRARANVQVSPQGVVFAREGASSFLVPAQDIVGVRTDRGVAGTVRAKDSVVVVTWRLGERVVETGFRADDGAEHRTLLDGLMAVISNHRPGEETA